MIDLRSNFAQRFQNFSFKELPKTIYQKKIWSIPLISNKDHFFGSLFTLDYTASRILLLISDSPLIFSGKRIVISVMKNLVCTLRRVALVTALSLSAKLLRDLNFAHQITKQNTHLNIHDLCSKLLGYHQNRSNSSYFLYECV